VSRSAYFKPRVIVFDPVLNATRCPVGILSLQTPIQLGCYVGDRNSPVPWSIGSKDPCEVLVKYS
jgi:hypothetical protein